MCKSRRSFLRYYTAGFGLLAMAACAAPQRPAHVAAPGWNPALKHLNLLAGEWTDTAETFHVASGESTPSRSRIRATWGLDDRFLELHGVTALDGGENVEIAGYWTHDPKEGVYRFWRFDSEGRVTQGTASYDEKRRKWNLQGETIDCVSGARHLGSGSMSHIEAHEKIWVWHEKNEGGNELISTAGGRSRRDPASAP